MLLFVRDIMKLNSFLILILLFCSFFSGQLSAQNTALAQKKVILVSKFIKYTQWPEEAIKSDFTVGVYNNIELYSFFSKHFANKAIGGKDIEVILVDTINQAKKVNLLYIPADKEREVEKLARKTRGLHVLLITENSKNVQESMVNLLFSQDESKISIKINYANINQEGLTVPEVSYFLDDKNDENILSLSQKAIKENRLNNELTQLKNYVLTQQNQLADLKEQLKANEEKLTKYSLALKQQTNKLKNAQQQNEQQQKALNKATQKVAQLTKNLAEKDQQLQMTKEEWLGAEADKAKEQAETIAQLTAQVTKQEKRVKAQQAQLAKAKKENEQLSSYSRLFYLVLFLAIVAIVIVVVFWQRNKKLAARNNQAEQTVQAIQAQLATREQQLSKSESLATMGFIASDITFAAGTAVDKALAHSVAIKDQESIKVLKPAVTLLENFNQIAADQDEDEKQSFDLAEYVNKIMTLFSVEFQASNIQYIYAGEQKLAVNSVPGYVALVLLNLVNNSVRHGFNNEGNGKISILIEKTSQGNTQLIYQDNGVGMDKKTLQQVFKPFFTTKPERDYLGLGMSIVYDLVKNKLHADIKLQSQTGKGTTVTITL